MASVAELRAAYKNADREERIEILGRIIDKLVKICDENGVDCRKEIKLTGKEARMMNDRK
jgi:hypothetical protein